MKISLRPVTIGSRSALLEDVGLRVHSHPRSGTHWLQACLNENFVFAKNYYDVYWNRPEHGFPDRYEEWDKDLKRFYIFREFEAVAASMLKPGMRERFGIADVPLNEFRDTPWNELVTLGDKWTGVWEGEEVTGEVNTAFALETRTPYQFWCDHVREWLELANERDDLFVVQYEVLQSDYQSTMMDIAKFLGKKRKHALLEVTRQVGWND